MTFLEYMETIKAKCFQLSIMQEIQAHLVKFMATDIEGDEYELTTEIAGAVVPVPQSAVEQYLWDLGASIEKLSGEIDELEAKEIINAKES